MRILVDNIQCVENGVNMRYVEIACHSDEADNRPTTGIVDGSITLFTNNYTVSIFNETSHAWGDPQPLFSSGS